MDPSEEKIPLNEAVERGLIPCSRCGARGADVKPVEGKPHFLCSKCGGSGRTGFLLGVLALVALAGIGWTVLRPKDEVEEIPLDASAPADPWLAQTLGLMREKRHADALARISERLKERPGNAGLHGLMGQCLMALRRDEEAIGHFRQAMEAEPEIATSAEVWIGIALQEMGRSAEALPLLRKESALAPLEGMRIDHLLDCLLDVENFDEALKLLDPAPKGGKQFWARHRALSYQGKTDEAKKLLESVERPVRGTLPLSALREAGDFPAAFKEVDELKTGLEAPAPKWAVIARAELSLCVEAGDAERLDRVGAQLAQAADPQLRATAVFYRALGRLIAGKADEAKVHARELLAAAPPGYTPLRLERLMMAHLVGEKKVEELEAEARRLSRFHANDIYWYLALATGDREWARKAAEATPARNFPYHAIQRMIKG
jgi:tetratricopeptide (TPR) repeat protein